MLMMQVCDDAEFLTGFAHSGVLTGAGRVWSRVEQEIVQFYESNSNYKLILTGAKIYSVLQEYFILLCFTG